MEYNEYILKIEIGRYQVNDNLALSLVTDDGMPFSRLSVNIDSLPDGWCTIDTNNFPDGIKLIEKYKLGERIGEITSGFCTYPIYEMNMSEVNKYARNN